MAFEVVLTEDAERDLDDLFTYIATHDSRSNAQYVLTRIVEIAGGLATAPGRGSQPKELRTLGDRDYRQIFFKPYRLIYRVIGRQGALYLISDGRRDMQSLLAHRLLRG